jgi:lysophospholipase L1-like esterase
MEILRMSLRFAAWLIGFGAVLDLTVFADVDREDRAAERWLFLGDSITYGGIYVDYVETWVLLNKEAPPEILDLGVSSETVSGLSEPDHPFPRPYLHERLTAVLERTKPTRVIACYGMNCGIYHPFSEARFAAYQRGIRDLITAVQAAGAEIVLLTPTPFAGRVAPRVGPSAGESFSWRKPTQDYNEVLGRYADWILSLDGKAGVRAFNIRPPLEAFMEQSFGKDPVHPNAFGHALMGEAFLVALGETTGSDLLATGMDSRVADPLWQALNERVRYQRETYDRALLNDIGHGNPAVREKITITLAEAEAMLPAIGHEIEALLGVQ